MTPSGFNPDKQAIHFAQNTYVCGKCLAYLTYTSQVTLGSRAESLPENGDTSLRDLNKSLPSGSDQPHLGFPVNDSIRRQHPIFLALATEWVRIAALPPHERAPLFKALEAKSRSPDAPLVALLLLPALSKMEDAARRADGNLRCLIAALAVERYRRKHDRWPDTLEQLVPEFLPAVPLDPEDGKPLRFHRRPDRVVVYSSIAKQIPGVGPEGYNPDEPTPPGIGVAVHLFDVKFRRQPPHPKPPIVDDDPQ